MIKWFNKNKKNIIESIIIFAVVLLLIITPLWIWFSKEVYGQPEFFRALRSQFMREVIIPVLGATITFGGVAYSVRRTVQSNERHQAMQDEYNRNTLIIERKQEALKGIRLHIYDFFRSIDKVRHFTEQSKLDTPEHKRAFNNLIRDILYIEVYVNDEVLDNMIDELRNNLYDPDKGVDIDDLIDSIKKHLKNIVKNLMKDIEEYSNT